MYRSLTRLQHRPSLVLRLGNPFQRHTASAPTDRLRNIGISAHIDSGKTTLTERILYYTGRIGSMHEVRGKDGVGATMDSMELERQKGITIKSAATFTQWDDHHINIIDTPGHVDFTVEVERALRVLDGAVLVLCGVSGVQSQTITVDRQMKRYGVSRLAFINKLDRMGADPWRVVSSMQEKLGIPCAALQMPIGLEAQLGGIVDLITQKAIFFDGATGEVLREEPIPAELQEEAVMRRQELIEQICDADDAFAEMVVMEGKEPTEDDLYAAVRRSVLARTFVPVLMGSAYKNKGVQLLLDAVVRYLPNPSESECTALDLLQDEAPVALSCDATKPLVALAFKLEESSFGQLTYMRVYQGTLRKGDTIMDMSSKKKVKVPRVIRMHSDQMEDVTEIRAGEICAIFGVDTASGSTFTDGSTQLSLTSMFVPDPVISLSIQVKDKGQSTAFSKALNRFMREDPTFRVHLDPESNETIISGMGELHLEIYTERLRREYGVDAVTGPPRVAYREAIEGSADIDYTHKKQTGGQGQFAKLVGRIEELDLDDLDEEELAVMRKKEQTNRFSNQVVGGTIPPQYIPAIEKGFEEACAEGPLIGFPVQNVQMTALDGAFHAVDSSELAFKTCTIQGFRQAFMQCNPTILEPQMEVEITSPAEYQQAVSGGINKRKGYIVTTDTSQAGYVTIHAEVALSNMFGYATDLRSMTQGKGEFSMAYQKHVSVPRDVQKALMEAAQRAKGGDAKK